MKYTTDLFIVVYLFYSLMDSTEYWKIIFDFFNKYWRSHFYKIIYNKKMFSYLKLHIGQANGFSPVWTLICCSNRRLSLNFLSHRVQGWINFPICLFSHILRWCLYLKNNKLGYFCLILFDISTPPVKLHSNSPT